MAGIGRDKKEDLVKAGTLRATLGASVTAFVAAAATVFTDGFDKIFDDKVAAEQLVWIKGGVVAAAILAIALVVAVDVASRAYAAGKKLQADGLSAAVHVLTAPSGLNATVTVGGATWNGTVAALRYDHAKPDNPEYLIVKNGGPPAWISSDDVALT